MVFDFKNSFPYNILTNSNSLPISTIFSPLSHFLKTPEISAGVLVGGPGSTLSCPAPLKNIRPKPALALKIAIAVASPSLFAAFSGQLPFLHARTLATHPLHAVVVVQ